MEESVAELLAVLSEELEVAPAIRHEDQVASVVSEVLLEGYEALTLFELSEAVVEALLPLFGLEVEQVDVEYLGATVLPYVQEILSLSES